MKEGYKLCPFCANEIKEKAIKCQYCGEFLKMEEKNEENTEVLKKECPFCMNDVDVIADKCPFCDEILDGNLSIKSHSDSEMNIPNKNNEQYKNKWIWVIFGIGIILGIVIILFVVLYNSSIGKQARVNHLVNKSIERNKDHKNFDEIKEDLNNAKESMPEQEAVFKEVGVLIDNFQKNLESIDQTSLSISTSDYKNVSKIQQSIETRKLYDKYFREYADGCMDLFKKYGKELGDSWNGKYSLNEFSKEIGKLADSVSNYKDKNIEFYNYLLNIQNDFYVESNGQVMFYEGGIEMDNYNKLSTSVYDAAIKFLEDYNKYKDYMEKYNRYWGL